MGDPGPMSNEDILRKTARDAIRAGKLPDRRPEQMWGGPGIGAHCTICDRPIGRNEVEFELQFARNGASSLGNYHVHPRCFAAWELEREDGDVASGSVLPAGSTEGMMPAGEREPPNKRGPA